MKAISSQIHAKWTGTSRGSWLLGRDCTTIPPPPQAESIKRSRTALESTFWDGNKRKWSNPGGRPGWQGIFLLAAELSSGLPFWRAGQVQVHSAWFPNFWREPWFQWDTGHLEMFWASSDTFPTQGPESGLVKDSLAPFHGEGSLGPTAWPLDGLPEWLDGSLLLHRDYDFIQTLAVTNQDYRALI